MSGGVIFLVQPDETLVRMNEAPYESEELLQRLLAQYPDILAGEQIDSRTPRRWLLISREYGVPAEDDGSDRWSIDHLFVDQDGVPTLVEVKRSSDTRIRREVIGQMFDYAANAVLHWPVSTIVQSFEERCVEEGVDSAGVLAKLIGDDDPEAFWTNVKTNLEAGRIRLVFVADEIPNELRTIVDFLAKQMDPADAFAIEVKQYVGSAPGLEGKPLRNLVPRLVAGSTPALPVGGARGRWTFDRFFDELESAHPELVQVARTLADLGTKLTGKAMEPGTGTITGSLKAEMRLTGISIALFSIYTTGELSFNLGWGAGLGKLGEGLSERYRAEAERHGFPIDRNGWGPGWNKFPLATIEQRFAAFNDFMTSVATELRELDLKRSAPGS